MQVGLKKSYETNKMDEKRNYFLFGTLILLLVIVGVYAFPPISLYSLIAEDVSYLNESNGTIIYEGSINITGDVNITEDLNVEGNITAENVFLPAYARISSNSTIQVLNIDTWTNITFTKSSDNPLIQNIEHTLNDSTNDTITIIDPGIYHIDLEVSVMEDSPITDSHIGFQIINGSGDRLKGSYSEIDTSKQNEELFHHDGFITELVAGDELTVQFISDDADVYATPHGTWNPSPASAQISLHKVANVNT